MILTLYPSLPANRALTRFSSSESTEGSNREILPEALREYVEEHKNDEELLISIASDLYNLISDFVHRNFPERARYTSSNNVVEATRLYLGLDQGFQRRTQQEVADLMRFTKSMASRRINMGKKILANNPDFERACRELIR